MMTNVVAEIRTRKGLKPEPTTRHTTLHNGVKWCRVPGTGYRVTTDGCRVSGDGHPGGENASAFDDGYGRKAPNYSSGSSSGTGFFGRKCL